MVSLKNKKLDILLIEDNLDHVRIIQWALEQSKTKNRLHVIHDGQTALDSLFSDNSPERYPQDYPDIIFLDLNLPKVDGREVLRKIKGDERLKTIPVIVISSSQRDDDVKRAYELGANTYVSKSLMFEEFTEALDLIKTYWSNVAQLPPK